MNRSRLFLAGLSILVVIVLGFVFSVPHTHDLPGAKPATISVATSTPVTLHDTFKKGVHTITGSVLAPTACTGVAASASLAGASSAPSILLTLSMSTDTGVCLQSPTALSFSTSITAPASASIMVVLNDATVTPTLR